jgi:hypothetical protein
MDQVLMLRIRERAYEIWVASGGDADENWLRAEAELLKSSSSGLVSSPIKKKRRATAPVSNGGADLLPSTRTRRRRR